MVNALMPEEQNPADSHLESARTARANDAEARKSRQTQGDRITSLETKVDMVLDESKRTQIDRLQQDAHLDRLQIKMDENATTLVTSQEHMTDFAEKTTTTLESLAATANLAVVAAEKAEQTAKDLAERTNARLMKMDLNGDAANLRLLSKATPSLLKIVPVLETLESMASGEIQKKIFGQELKRKLQWTRGWAFRVFASAVIGAVVYALLQSVFHLSILFHG